MGSIARLGSDYHRQHFLTRAATLQLRGCFALTELGHGSNVRGIETTATFDPVRDEFVINTPHGDRPEVLDWWGRPVGPDRHRLRPGLY